MADTNSIFTIKNYFSRHNGLQRVNRFDVSFAGLPSAAQGEIDSENFYPVNYASIGSRLIDGIADNMSGYGYGRIQPRSQKFSGGVLLGFGISNDNHILKLFQAWFNHLYSGGRVTGAVNNRYTAQFYHTSVYPATMTLRALDPNGVPNSTFTFYEVMPIETQPIEFTMLKSNDYLSYQVIINFKEYIQS
jgi:hypothetical protein